MTLPTPFREAQQYRPAETVASAGVELPVRFADAVAEYAAARQGAVLFDRSDRGLMLVEGAERKAWLHSLLTNAILPLTEGGGCYAFACNLKGRALFDANVLELGDGLWLDVSLGAMAAAATHFDRHLFAEDVRIRDVTGQHARLACSGPQAGRLAESLGVGELGRFPVLHSVSVVGGARLFRHDFAGVVGFELVVPRGEAAAWWDRLAGEARPAGLATLDVLRVEAGIPWWGRDIDESVLPPETGPAVRGVAANKGCYLGHEVMERMRARGALARRLVTLRVGDGAGLALPAALHRDSSEVGRITSLVRHPVESYWPGLAYLSTAVTGFADIVTGEPPREVRICSV